MCTYVIRIKSFYFIGVTIKNNHGKLKKKNSYCNIQCLLFIWVICKKNLVYLFQILSNKKLNRFLLSHLNSSLLLQILACCFKCLLAALNACCFKLSLLQIIVCCLKSLLDGSNAWLLLQMFTFCYKCFINIRNIWLVLPMLNCIFILMYII